MCSSARSNTVLIHNAVTTCCREYGYRRRGDRVYSYCLANNVIIYRLSPGLCPSSGGCSPSINAFCLLAPPRLYLTLVLLFSSPLRREREEGGRERERGGGRERGGERERERGEREREGREREVCVCVCVCVGGGGLGEGGGGLRI